MVPVLSMRALGMVFSPRGPDRVDEYGASLFAAAKFTSQSRTAEIAASDAATAVFGLAREKLFSINEPD